MAFLAPSSQGTGPHNPVIRQAVLDGSFMSAWRNTDAARLISSDRKGAIENPRGSAMESSPVGGYVTVNRSPGDTYINPTIAGSNPAALAPLAGQRNTLRMCVRVDPIVLTGF